MTTEVATVPESSRPARFKLPALVIPDSAIEAVKWLALLLMTLDHVDKYLCHETVPALFDAGRLAMPLFATIFGYNMARAQENGRQPYSRTIRRLLLSWACATPVCLALGGLAWGWWPLNVMSLFALAAAVMWLAEGTGVVRLAAAGLLFVVGGAFVEYWWPGMVLCLAAWRYAKRPTWTALTMWLCAVASLYVINHNWWALAAIPVLLLATRIDLPVPRHRLLFYVYYPAHLWVILLVAVVAHVVH